MSDKAQIGKLIFDVMNVIDKLHAPLLDPDEDFGPDLSSGAVKYLNADETQRIYQIKLITAILEIRENGRDFDTMTSNLEAWFDGQKVLQAKLYIIHEDEHDWRYDREEIIQFESGPWVDELRLTLKRLDLMLKAKKAEWDAEGESMSQQKLAQRILKRREKN